MSSLLSVFILSFTVAVAVTIGIFTAYAAVVGILHSLARRNHPTSTQPALLHNQARAAHAGGD